MNFQNYKLTFMRIRLLIIVAALFFGGGQLIAQVVTVTPGAFKSKDTITIEVDVTGTDVAGIEPLYIWAFLNMPENPVAQSAPNGVPGGNGSWNSSNEAMKMTKVGPNKWKFGMRPTVFFAEVPANIVQIGFLVKAKDGGGTPEKKTKNLAVTPDPLIFKEVENRVFPPKADAQDAMSINYNQAKASTINAGRMVVSFAEVAAYEAGGTVQIGTTKTNLPVVKTATTIYGYTFIPNTLFTVPAGKKIAVIKYRFGGKLPGTNDVVYSDWAEYQLPTLTY